MTNKAIGNILIASLTLLIVTGIFSPMISAEAYDSITTLGGLTLGIFGYWGASRLVK